MTANFDKARLLIATILVMLCVFGCSVQNAGRRQGSIMDSGKASPWFGIGTDTEENFYYLLGDRFQEPGRVPCRLAAQIRPGEVFLLLVVELEAEGEAEAEDFRGRRSVLLPAPEGQGSVGMLYFSPADLSREIPAEGLIFRIRGVQPETSCRIPREAAAIFLKSLDAVFIKE